MNLIKWTQQTKLAGCIFPTIELFHIWASRWMVETLRLGILIMTQESRRWKMMKVPSRNDEVSQVTSPLNVSVWVFMFVLAPPLCWFVRVPVLYISHAVKILYIYICFLFAFSDLTCVHYIHILSWSIQVCRHHKSPSFPIASHVTITEAWKSWEISSH